MFTKPFNKVAKTYGLSPFKSFLDLIEGAYVLLSDVPQMIGITQLPENYKYIGPIFTRLDTEIPREILDLPRDKPIVYFAMGSSGNAQIIKEIIEGFEGKPYRVIAPVQQLISGTIVNVPNNVLITGWIPAHKVNPMANISVIHGGQGTVYTACLSGVPVVGVAMGPEQESNLNCLVRLGFGIRIRKRRVTSRAILDAIEALLGSQEAQRKAREFQKIVTTWHGPTNAAKFFSETFGN